MRRLVRFLVAASLGAPSVATLSACTVHATTTTAEAPPPPPPPPAPPPPAPAPPAPAATYVAPPAPAPAPPPAPARTEAHPAYLHALSDLRNARAHLERRGGDPAMRWDERAAVEAIDRAITDIRRAAIDDGKNLQDHPPIDAHEPRAGRLHEALSALQSARNDVNQEEDNVFANGLRARGIRNVDEAIRVTEQGIAEAEAIARPAAPAPVVVAPPPPPPPPAAHPQVHPAYLHALSDLREAREDLARRGGDPQMKWDERGAVQAVDRAIVDIRQAAMDDGKSLQDHPPVDAKERRVGRLRRALTALKAARNDVAHEEDNGAAGAARARGLANIDEAIRFAEQGIAEAEHAILSAGALARLEHASGGRLFSREKVRPLEAGGRSTETGALQPRTHALLQAAGGRSTETGALQPRTHALLQAAGGRSTKTGALQPRTHALLQAAGGHPTKAGAFTPRASGLPHETGGRPTKTNALPSRANGLPHETGGRPTKTGASPPPGHDAPS